ncbi:radical SAM protein [Kitasatospora sp. A2-31]|uniref:radical SAM protein n=1 Tax=Kitasatospora sp. A2-31 TaxID=2916414 RepID=UPI0027E32876|nr:radical SAM protein [Kitasatospora sp. A2-31]MCG6497198.1 radical SAM protein [Kitasatospora sp. A2-31]
MIGEVTGISVIRMLYLQLLYRCNMDCLHCFHGERLKHADAFSPEEAINLLTLMRDQYDTEGVTLLGGEPFVYKDLTQVVRYAKQELGLQVEICTNGYRIERRLTEIAPYLDVLRISLEGIGATNDRIRKFGSYQGALSALDLARELGIRTGATMTVTSQNIEEVLPLARTLQEYGAAQLKLHHLRPVGNASSHPELLVTDRALYARLRQQIHGATDLTIQVVLDEDLSLDGAPEIGPPINGLREIPRIEADPRGALTMSCNAVGKDSHAFWYDKAADRIVHRPSAIDEITLSVPAVVYERV